MNAPPEIIGSPPILASAICQELVCQQYWYRGKLSDAFNVIFLLVKGIWHRLYFDHGIIFWRIAKAPPTPLEAQGIDASYRIIDLGMKLDVRGKKLEMYDMATIQRGSQVSFVFQGGRRVVFQNINDRTSLVE